MSNEKYYQCPICKLYYKEKELAKKCKTWCSKHKSCNIEYLKYAVQPK